MAYNSAHTGPEIDAAVEMLGQVQSARDATSSDRSAVVALASQVAANASQVGAQAATVNEKTSQVLASALEVERAHSEVLSASEIAVDAKDAAALSAGSAQTSQASASASASAAAQSQVAAGLSEQVAAGNAESSSADRLVVEALAQQVEADRVSSQISSDSAALSALNAAAVVTGGTATIAPAPGKIPLADVQGKISSEWLGADMARIADIRDDADPAKGAAQVGWDGETVGAQMNLSKKLANYTAMRAYTGPASRVEVTKFGIAGNFTRRAFTVGDVDNGGTVIVSNNGLWTMVRDYTGPISLWWFECPLDGTTNADAAFAKFTATVKNGEALIPPIKYVATAINFQLVGQSPFVGGLKVYASGATIVGECAITVDSCKRLRIDGLEGLQTDIKLNGAWYMIGNGLKLRDIILGSATGTQFSSNYWVNFAEGCQFQSIITAANATQGSNKLSWDNCYFRGDAGQGYLSTRDYFIKFLANQTAQSWVFTNCDVSYFVVDMLYADVAAAQDIELNFEGCYFDTKYPKLLSRPKARLIVNNSHAANDQPNYAAISQVARGSSDSWRGDRAAGWKSFTGLNLIPNGDFYDILPLYVGANLPLSAHNNAVITTKTGGGINGNYINVNQVLTSTNQIRFRPKSLPMTARYTSVVVARNADAGNKTLRVGVAGVFFNAVVTDSEWTVITLTTALDLVAGTNTGDTQIFTEDGTGFNIDICYAGTFVGESVPLFLPALRRQSLDGSMSWNPASVAAGAQLTQDVTVIGAALGDFARASFGASLQGMTLAASVIGADTVQVTMRNGTAAAIDLGSSTLRVRVDKSGY